MQMDDTQLYGLFAIPRNEDGSPNLPNPFDDGDLPSPEVCYKRFLWLNGITDRMKQEQLWKAEKDRREGSP